MHNKKLALFDFDGTITKRDTLFEFIRYFYSTPKYYLGLLILSPFILMFKIKLIPNWKAKEKILTYFFKDIQESIFVDKCQQFVKIRLPDILRKDALKKISELKQKGVVIAVVTASAESWVMPWCIEEGLECIATKLEIKNGFLTGKISGKNCHGIEKVSRIRQKFSSTKFETILAYGDSKGDLPMLKLAVTPQYKIFND